MQANENQIKQGRHLVAVEYLLRVCGWLAVLNTEKIAGSVLKISQGHANYYCVSLALAALIFVAIHRLGPEPIIRDLKEICFYDVLVQVYGLCLYLTGVDFATYLVLANSVVAVKFIRIIWWGKNCDGELLAAWPTFGLLGLFSTTQTDEKMSKRQVVAVYFACCAAVLVSYIGWKTLGSLPPEEMHVASLIAVMIFTHRASTDIKSREKQRIESIRELERTKLIAEFNADAAARNEDLRGATHDLNNPVWAMSFTAREIVNAPDLETAKAIAQNMEAGLHDLTDMIVEVVEMARVGTKLKTPLDDVIFMPALCRHFAKELGALARERGVTLGFDDAEVAVKSNEWLFKRIIHNLLINAIVHGKKKTRVRLSIRQSGDFCYIRVCDSGPGIPDADGPDRAANFKNLIFTTHRAKDTKPDQPNNKVTGHGLGLRGVMRMSNTLGLEMTMKSRVGLGTMFRFKVPIATLDDLPDF